MSKKNKVYIASDHAGVELKQIITQELANWEWINLGPDTKDSVDYPDFAEKLCNKVITENGKGVLICATGIGMSITANKIEGIRAAHVENPTSAKLTREHNDSNVLCIGALFLEPKTAKQIVETWLETNFSQETRHQNRIDKISAIEKGKK